MLGTIIAGVAVGIAAIAAVSNSGTRRRQDEHVRRQRRHNTQQEESVNKINKEINTIFQDQKQMNEILKKREKTNEKFRKKMMERDRKREKEMRKIENQLRDNREEQERVQKEIDRMKRESRKYKDEEERRMKSLINEHKDKKARLEQEEKVKEKERDERKSKQEYSKQMQRNARREIQKYKKAIKSLIKENDIAAIEEILEQMEQYTTILQSMTVDEQMDLNVSLQYIKNILAIYEDLGDMFFYQGLSEKAVEMFKKYIDLNVSEKTDPMILYKYAKSLYIMGRYNDALQELNDISLSEIEANAGLKDIGYKIDKLYFYIYLSMEDSVRIKEYGEKMVNQYSDDNYKINELIKMIKKYIDYSHSTDMMISYLALVVRYKRHYNLADILQDEIYSGFEYRDFYLAVQKYRESKYQEAKKLFEKYSDNDLALAYIIRSEKKMMEGDETYTPTKSIGKLNTLLNKFENMVSSSSKKGVDLRESFYKENKGLIYLDSNKTEHYFRFYLDLLAVKLYFLLNEAKYDELYKIIQEINEDYFEESYFISTKFKLQLAHYYHFFNEQNSDDKTNYIYNILKKHSTKLELEAYLKDEIEFNKTFEDIYSNLNENLEYIENPFYKGVLVENRTNGKKYTMLETYVENMNKNKEQERENLIQQEMSLGEQYTNLASIYHYWIEGGISKLILPEFENSLSAYIEQSGGFNTDNIDEIQRYAVQLIDIFKSLEDADVVLPSIIPEQIMIDKNNNLMLRSCLFNHSFGSGSASSAYSSTTVAINKYKSPDIKANRDQKSNYYILGLLLYELFYGDFLFAGVKDFKSIRSLHLEMDVEKIHTHPLRERWIISKNKSETVKVDKIDLDEDSSIPVSIQKMIKSLLSADRNKRPDNLESLKTIINEIELNKTTVKKHSMLTEGKLVEFIKKLESVEVCCRNESLKNKLQHHLSDGINISSDYQGEYDLIINSEGESINVKKIGSMYRIDGTEGKNQIESKKLKNRDKTNRKQDKTDKIANAKKDDKSDRDTGEILSRITDLISKSVKYQSYLFILRQALTDLINNDLYNTVDSEFIKNTEKVLLDCNPEGDFNRTLNKLKMRKIEYKEFISLSKNIINSIERGA